MKNASNDTRGRSPGASTTSAIGRRTFRNLASWTFFSMTRFEPISATMRSSFGRLKAAVCTPWLPSPAASTTLTTRMGASSPRRGLRNSSGMGRWSSMSCSSAPNRASLDDSAASRTVTKASNAAL